MPDITLCANEECILRDDCKRNPEKYVNISDYQSWAYFREYEDDKGIITCDHFREYSHGS